MTMKGMQNEQWKRQKKIPQRYAVELQRDALWWQKAQNNHYETIRQVEQHKDAKQAQRCDNNYKAMENHDIRDADGLHSDTNQHATTKIKHKP